METKVPPTETKKSVKITNYLTFNKNPFCVKLQSKFHKPDTEHKYVRGEDGKDYGMYEIPKGKVILHDPKPYTKLFKGNTSMLMALSESSVRMFYYICENLQPGNDEVCIIKEDYLTFAGYTNGSKLTYYRAIEGLLKMEIIARKGGSTFCFFINPDVVFNGDRTKLSNIEVVNKGN